MQPEDMEVKELRTTVTLTQAQVEILTHTMYRAAGGFYCGDSPDMKLLIKLGLMRSVGRKSFLLDEFFKLTPKGKAYVNAIEKG